ncbi:Ankyrin [Trichoderma parareesei]|uniref:Ankyrin n=1 Tax=Trichoderma parareesei TaxID=858221 RepID=A0A2H2ZNH2_TRIPA|nr:Ankyrin [Trichoderma parareesei]
METIYDAAALGRITDLASLDPYKSADSEFGIDKPDDKGRTALSHAASRGKIDVVKFLISQKANVNAQDNRKRTVLWYAAQSDPSVTRQERFVTVEYLLQEHADPNIPASNGSTALSKFIEHREPTVIKLLRDYGASTDHKVQRGSATVSIEELARATKDPDVIEAVILKPGQTSSRDEAVTEIINYLFRSIGYMNTAFGGVVRRFFGISGDIHAPLQAVPMEKQLSDSDSGIDIRHLEEDKVAAPPSRIFGYSDIDAPVGTAGTVGFDTAALDKDNETQGDNEDKVPHVSEISKKTTAKQFQAGMTKFIDDTGLGCFFAEDDKFLEDVAMKAVELENREDEVLNSKKDIQDITKLALYQPVFYCDDSTSMKSGTRARDQVDLVRRVARISTLLVPDGCGTGLQFINKRHTLDDNLKAEQVEEIMRSVEPRGNTKIGTNLERKILNPLIYDVIDSGKKLERPVLVSCITDGCASGEPSTEFRDAIVRCVDYLREKNYPPTAVRFQISQIGNDRGAESFLNQLRDDPLLKDVLFCTTQRLDEEYKKLNENEEDLERWLLQTLMGPILSLGRK